MYETRGNAKFYYSYDANGTLYSVKYTLTDSSDLMTYYFTHNSRGDIVGIYNGAGQLRAHYEYDAWGNVLSVTDQNGNAITSATHIGNLNPFRYRGYYLDSETGLYYLMSRYYDPVTHRFVNADGYFQSGGDLLDSNMSAYCRNNPISFVDPTGTEVKTLYEWQKELTNGGSHSYDISDISALQRQGYSNNDKFNLNSDGTFTEYNLFYKVTDTFGAVIFSLEFDLDVGFGLGGSATFGFVEISALYELLTLSFHLDIEDINFGIKNAQQSGLSLAGVNLFGWDHSNFYDIPSGKNIEKSSESHVVGVSAGAFVGFGISAEVGWNIDYIAKRLEEIWF